jgi:hypothetical protein
MQDNQDMGPSTDKVPSTREYKKNPGGRDFPHDSRPVLGPTQPPAQCVKGKGKGFSQQA